MTAKSAISAIVGTAGAGFAALTYGTFRRDLNRAEKRVSTGSRIVNTKCGPIEVASVGSGFPLLIIHGAGGGFDQLQDFETEAHLSEFGFRLIFVSRFGYLRTPLPWDASTTAQAEAYVELLDILGISKVGVIAVSAGAPVTQQPHSINRR